MANRPTIKTNYVPRDVLYWHELTAKEQAEHDYLDNETAQLDATFTRYRGVVYYLNDFQRAPNTIFPRWDGYHGDSYFSGILVRYAGHDCQRVIMATYFA